ncbi:hypothetical protein VKT23_006298 [Stygiomarasmius scandens]|uniref:Uncharacterized protein n=1 Tax=Marasmiellus scandens TaxID=2682957 RepID=A0ABR1JQ83_9AGAR
MLSRILFGLSIAVAVFLLALLASPMLASATLVQISHWLDSLSSFVPFFPASLNADYDFLSTTSSLTDVKSDWNLTVGPLSYSTDNLIFNTASSLLQHWPNARYRNGHSVVPGRIPLGTVFYHGRSSPEMVESSRAGQKIKILPGTQEWVATDPEHSLMFCGIESGADVSTTNATASKDKPESENRSDCWFITLVTTRELRVLYFDGSSAAKMFGGSMDSQDVFAYRNELEMENASSSWDDPDRIFGEVERLKRLCQWVEEKGLGVDGFVRMEMDFEVMLCDMASGMEVVSFSNLAHSANPKSISNSAPEPDASTPSKVPNPRRTIRNFELVRSASQHHAYPGEVKVQLDLDGFVSFYDGDLVKRRPVENGDEVKYLADRWTHRVRDTNKEDLRRVRQRVEEVLMDMKNSHGRNSGIDWDLIMQVLVKRYASRLDVLKYLLEASGDEPGATRTDGERVQIFFNQLDVALTPFILASARPESSESLLSPEWASPVYRLCSTTHTLYLHSPHIMKKMSKSEMTLLNAVEGTNQEICRVLVGIWAEGVENGLGLEKMYYIDKAGTNQLKVLKEKWEKDLISLMRWLDWSVWETCRPSCGPEEICYMPTWPYFAGNGGPPPGPAQGPDGLVRAREESEENDWMRPKPLCIRKVAPYKF